MRTYAEIDIDYEQFADLSLDLHWIQLPTALLIERRKAQRAAALPENHRIILVPADPSYSPIEEELWPLINETIHATLRPPSRGFRESGGRR